MKKIFIIAAFIAATLGAKAQATITVNNYTPEAITIHAQAIDANGCSDGIFSQNNAPSGNFTIAAGSSMTPTTFGPTYVTDASWSWNPSGTTMYQFITLDVSDGCDGNGVNTVCGTSVTMSTYTDCSSNTRTISWSSDHSTPPNITVNVQ